jgi:hypothetical protein
VIGSPAGYVMPQYATAINLAGSQLDNLAQRVISAEQHAPFIRRRVSDNGRQLSRNSEYITLPAHALATLERRFHYGRRQIVIRCRHRISARPCR